MLTTVKIRRVTEYHRKIYPIVRCKDTLGTDKWVGDTDFWFKIWWFSTWNGLRYELRRFSDRPDFLNILLKSQREIPDRLKIVIFIFSILKFVPDHVSNQQKFRHKILTNEIVSQTVPYGKSYSLLRNNPYLGIVM